MHSRREKGVRSHLHLVAQPFEQGIDGPIPEFADLHTRKAVLATIALCDFASEIPRDFLNTQAQRRATINSTGNKNN